MRHIKAITLLLLVGTLVLWAGGTVADADVLQGRYIRDADYAAIFDYRAMDGEDLFFAWKEEVCTDAEASGWMQDVLGLLDRVRAIGGGFDAHKPSVYVLDQTLTGRVMASGGKIFCTPDMLQDKAFEIALIDRLIGGVETWKAYAIYEMLYPAQEAREQYQAYCVVSDDLSLLNLYSWHFSTQFCTKGEIDITCRLAGDLAEYIIKQHGMQNFLESDHMAYVDGWIRKMGRVKDYTLEDDPRLREFKTIAFTDEYPFAISDGLNAFYMRYDPCRMRDRQDVTFFVSTMVENRNALQAYLAQNLAEGQAITQQGDAALLNYYFNPNAYGIRPQFRGNMLFCAGVIGMAHELAHLLCEYQSTLPPGDGSRYWVTEGLTDYLAIFVAQDGIYKRVMYEACTGDPENDWHAYLGIPTKFAPAKDIYIAKGGRLDSPDAFDMGLFYHSLALYTLDHDITSFYAYRIGTLRNAPADRWVQGDDLTYLHAGSFVAYLIEEYSFA